MKRHLELEYALGEGWLAPWLDGLRQGRAVASSCTTCGAGQFPPLRDCPNCHRPSNGWTTLAGTASILSRTIGADGDFALVQFEGAERAAIARAEALPNDANRAVLGSCPEGPPTIRLEPEPEA